MTCPQFLDHLGQKVGRMVRKVEEHLLTMSCLFLGPCTKMVQSHMAQVILGIVHCLLEERDKQGELITPIKETVKEELDFLDNFLPL
jgi:hypothetical protein